MKCRIVRNNRASSILISTIGDVLIENNHFSTCTYTGIMVSGFNDFWYESGTVQDLVIRNNVFEDLGMETCNVPILEIEGTLNDESKPLYAKP